VEKGITESGRRPHGRQARALKGPERTRRNVRTYIIIIIIRSFGVSRIEEHFSAGRRFVKTTRYFTPPNVRHT